MQPPPPAPAGSVGILCHADLCRPAGHPEIFFFPLLLYRVDPMAQQLKKKKSYLTIDQYLIKAEGEA